MQPILASLCLVAAAVCVAPALAADAGDAPIAKVLSMISGLQAKVISEGEAAQKEYAEFAEWCEDRARDLSHEIKTGKAEVAELQASIDEQAATINSLTAKVEQLAADIATDTADLAAASEVRGKESADFATEEKELIETVDTITRAIGVLEKELKSGGASMLQLRNAASLTQVLTTMVQASMLGSSDAGRLTALVQQASDDQSEQEPGAPAAATYENHSGGIIETLQDLLDKAESALADARKKENASKNQFEMLKQSLEDQIKFANKELEAAKTGIAAAAEKKSTAEGDLQVATKELAADVAAQEALHHDCMERAEDFEAETKSRGEELAALAEAKKVIVEATSEALAQVSFVQVATRARLSSGMDLANFEAVRFVRDLSRKHNSNSLAQLAARMAFAMRNGAGANGAFDKVKGLITDMIEKLEGEADADSSKKAYCDRELGETGSKKTEKSDKVASLSTKIDEATAKSAQLTEEVAKLEGELANLVKTQAEMDKLRQQEKDLYDASKAEQEKALKGIRLALQVLRDYYAKKDAAHKSATGSASGIIGLLEVCESDIAKELAEITTAEEAAVAGYEKVTKENEIEKVTKAKDVEYKTKEIKDLAQLTAELTADRAGVQTELDAVVEYLRKIEEECIAKAETYEERKERRAAEIAGLKEALQILESETALLQRGRSLRRGHVRGAGVLAA